MPNAATYSTLERLRDGSVIEIRALKPDDEADLVAAVSHLGAQSLYRRFFGFKHAFSDQEKAYFLNVDFVNHVALVAVVRADERPEIIGGGRYVVVRPGAAEVAFAVADEFQGQGLGTLLIRHLVRLAREAGLKELTADVLAENAAMLKVFARSGLGVTTRRAGAVVEVTLALS